MAFPVVLNGRTYTLADFEGTNYVDGLPDAFEDFVTHAGDIYNDTSTSSVAIGTGSKTFTVSAGKPYQAGTPLRIADAAAPETNFLDCIVTSYSGTSLVVNAFGFAGSGTKTSWTVNIGGAKTIDGTLAISQGGTGATTAAAARTALGLGTGDSPTFAGLTVTGSTSFSDIDIDNVGDIAVDSISGDGDADTTITFAGSDTINIAAGGSTIQSITTTGIDVTGTVTADGLTLGSEGDQISIPTSAGFSGVITTGDTISGNAFEFKNGNAVVLISDTNDSGATGGVDATLIARGSSATKTALFDVNGDISFYEDTGTTAKFFWDAAEERLGIGTSSPTVTNGKGLHLANPAGPATRLHITDNTTGETSSDGTELLVSGGDFYIDQKEAKSIIAYTNGEERMRIDSSGNVGIGTSSPSSQLHLSKAGGTLIKLGTSQNTSEIEARESGSANLLVFSSNNSVDHMAIDENGNVGIGNSVMSSMFSSSQNLVVGTGSGNNGMTVYSQSNAAGDIAFADATTDPAYYSGLIRYDHSLDAMRLFTSSIERMRIDSSGNVGIGVSNPSAYAANADNLVVGGEANVGMHFDSNSSTGNGGIYFSDQASVKGILAYSHTDDAMEFYTNGTTERMRIDSSGSLLHGTTSSSIYNATSGDGVNIKGQQGQIIIAKNATSTADPALWLNNTGVDGSIATFAKDGSTVGSIGTLSSKIYVGSDDTSIFFDSLRDALVPHNASTNAARDAAINLGRDVVRFKDLYLSGGAYLGGTGSANKLDDYEEGDYDVTITCGTSGTVTLNSSVNRAQYTKVGRMVHISGFVSVSSVSSPVGNFQINLPFTPANLTDRAGDSAASLVVQNVVSANISDFVGTINEAQAVIYVQLGDASTVQNDSAQELSSGTLIHFSATYPAA